MYRYSILTFIFNGYEKLREVENKQDDVEYICVTDDPNLKSNTWKLIIDPDLEEKGPFDKCFSVRYNPFKYCSTDICVRIDGSIQIHSSLDNIIDDFNEGGYDMCLELHPYRYNLIDEYKTWIAARGYPQRTASLATSIMEYCRYPFDYKGMFQLNFSIVRKNKLNDDINNMVYAFIRLTGTDNDNVDRLDQTWFSFVVNKFFNMAKVLPVSQHIFKSEMLTWHIHNRDTEVPLWEDQLCPTYMFNKLVEIKRY